MQNAEKLSISLTPEMIAAVRRSVDAGEYASTSEAIRDAIRLWQRERAEQAERIAALKARITESASDRRPPLSADGVRARLDALHRATSGPSEP